MVFWYLDNQIWEKSILLIGKRNAKKEKQHTITFLKQVSSFIIQKIKWQHKFWQSLNRNQRKRFPEWTKRGFTFIARLSENWSQFEKSINGTLISSTDWIFVSFLLIPDQFGSFMVLLLSFFWDMFYRTFAFQVAFPFKYAVEQIKWVFGDN